MRPALAPTEPGLPGGHALTDGASDQGSHDTGEHESPLGRGDMVDRYVILASLGQGGMGVVFAAYDPELDRKVALKLLLPAAAAQSGTRSESRTRLLREAQALAQLSHPAVVAVHDVGTVGDQVWLAMEFIDGVTLANWCERPRTWREVLELFRRAGEGLAAAHAAGLVHRDFKPKSRSPLGHPLFSPNGRILKFRGVLRRGPWRVAPRYAAVLATGWQQRTTPAPPGLAGEHGRRSTVITDDHGPALGAELQSGRGIVIWIWRSAHSAPSWKDSRGTSHSMSDLDSRILQVGARGGSSTNPGCS